MNLKAKNEMKGKHKMNNEIYKALKSVFEIIRAAHLVLPLQSTLEIYHHYGVERFNETGAVFINVVNKEYCKSYAVILPGQVYPTHYHKIKQETFYVLYGDLVVTRDGSRHTLRPGEMLDVERGKNIPFSAQQEQFLRRYLRLMLEMIPYILIKRLVVRLMNKEKHL